MLTLEVISSHILMREGKTTIQLQGTKQHLGKVPKRNHSSMHHVAMVTKPLKLLHKGFHVKFC